MVKEATGILVYCKEFAFGILLLIDRVAGWLKAL